MSDQKQIFSRRIPNKVSLSQNHQSKHDAIPDDRIYIEWSRDASSGLASNSFRRFLQLVLRKDASSSPCASPIEFPRELNFSLVLQFRKSVRIATHRQDDLPTVPNGHSLPTAATAGCRVVDNTPVPPPAIPAPGPLVQRRQADSVRNSAAIGPPSARLRRRLDPVRRVVRDPRCVAAA